ncbi:putative membrane protein YdgA-like protein [Legionella lansingensis]|uniref:Putative membrane protein YdgA-like protein n=1 Tax=Legionella lansingensis TaxID=45067 RepID=A0A0W0VR71_9GAMM|nr:YdgA family protein [Legionella lansingensis]KTD22214.1 putative membrane protein YdgA-like protein [Legionella lansingensis]SNV55070.1 putative membrane protein YdgA-like protein [Legionella lansingensis]
MKKFIGLVVILAVLVLGSYYGMGYLTEQKVKESLNFVNRSDGLAATIVKYDRGWFTSTATLNWHIHIPEQTTQTNGKTETTPAQDYKMQMPVTIYHGPVIFSDKGVKFGLGYAHTALKMPAEYTQQFNTLFTSESTSPTVVIDFFVSYLGNSNVDMSVPAFKLFAKEGNATFEWLGMSTSTNFSSDLDKVGGNITIDGLSFKKDQVNTKMSTVTSEYNLHRTDKGLFLGDASLSFPSFVVMDSDKKLFELGQFDIHSDSDIENGLFNSHFKTSIEKIVANNKTYGPGSLEVAIRNLDADALARLNAQAQQVQQGTEAERQRAMLAMLPELPKLFSKGAEFEVTEMNFVMPQGTIEGNLMVSLPKGEMSNPFEIIQRVQGNGKLKVPAVVVKELFTESIKQRMMSPQGQQDDGDKQGITQQIQPQNSTDATAQAAANSSDVSQQAVALADKQLATLVQNGVLAQQGSDYIVEVSLNQGQFTINGKPYSPEMMKF